MEPEDRDPSGGGPNDDAPPAANIVRDIWVSCQPNQSAARQAVFHIGSESTRNSRALPAGLPTRPEKRSVRHQRGDPLGYFAHRDDGLDRLALGIDGGDGFDGGVGDVDRLAV